MANIPYTAEYNVFAVETQHTEQPENMNDKSLMEKVDSNTTPDSSDMCNNEFHVDHNTDDNEDEHLQSRLEHQLDKPITHETIVLVKDLLMPLADKTRYVQYLEKEVDALQSDKNDFSNEYDLLLQECLSKDIMCSILHSLADIDEQTKMQCLYLEKIKESECLKIKLSKQTKNEQLKNDKVWKQKESSSFRDQNEQYFAIQDLKAQLQDKNITISELKKLIENMKDKGVDTNFEKPSILGKPPLQPVKCALACGKAEAVEELHEKKLLTVPAPPLEREPGVTRHRFVIMAGLTLARHATEGAEAQPDYFLKPDVAQLQVPIFACPRDILNPFALEKEIPLEESVRAHIPVLMEYQLAWSTVSPKDSNFWEA
ncbi:hypothetical protein Tco_1253945 [Tanacetum coccineum]